MCAPILTVNDLKLADFFRWKLAQIIKISQTKSLKLSEQKIALNKSKTFKTKSSKLAGHCELTETLHLIRTRRLKPPYELCGCQQDMW